MTQKKKQPVAAYALVSALVIAADQALKAWVCRHIPLYPSAAEQVRLLPGIVHLSHIRNAGVAFGLLQGGRWAFLALLGVFAALVIWALATGKLTKGWERWCAVVVLAGAVGNGIDRALNGYVVDMFEVEFMEFAVFNLADIFINVACILFVVLTLFSRDGEKMK
ncbi:MAG: signal peptidase II [Oscillospiraceae bacterium]|nr:signal peptidase II [Oscillospiraceae bacterium]